MHQFLVSLAKSLDITANLCLQVHVYYRTNNDFNGFVLAAAAAVMVVVMVGVEVVVSNY